MHAFTVLILTTVPEIVITVVPHQYHLFCLVKAMVFPVVMYGYESWTIKKLSAEELMLLNCGVAEILESPLDCKDIKPPYPVGSQS